MCRYLVGRGAENLEFLGHLFGQFFGEKHLQPRALNNVRFFFRHESTRDRRCDYRDSRVRHYGFEREMPPVHHAASVMSNILHYSSNVAQ